jgi:hypothetical protein
MLLLCRSILLDEEGAAALQDFGPVPGGPAGLDFGRDYQGKGLNLYRTLNYISGCSTVRYCLSVSGVAYPDLSLHMVSGTRISIKLFS